MFDIGDVFDVLSDYRKRASLTVITADEILAEHCRTKHTRATAARAALAPSFGARRVTAHCGSSGEGDSTQHILYIGIHLRKADPRNRWKNSTIRRQALAMLKRAKVQLYRTGYDFSNGHDNYAVVLDVYRLRSR